MELGAVVGLLDLEQADAASRQVLERLIIRELQVQRALQTGIRASDADIDQALTTLAQQNNMSVQQLREVIEGDGEDFAEFRRNIGEEIMAERLRQRIVNGMDPVTDTEIDILLASEDLGGGEYNVSHILLTLPDGSTQQHHAVTGSRGLAVFRLRSGAGPYTLTVTDITKSGYSFDPVHSVLSKTLIVP